VDHLLKLINEYRIFNYNLKIKLFLFLTVMVFMLA